MRKNANTRPSIFSHLALLLAVVTLGGLALFGGARPAFAATGTFQFSSGTYSVNEGAVVTLTVTRTSGTSGAVNVAWHTGGGTAVAGTNYVAVIAGNFHFNDGDASVTQTIQTFNNVSGGNRTFNAIIDSVDGGTTGSPLTAQVTIVDLDAVAPTFTFSTSNYNVNEPDGTVTVTVNRAGLSGSAVTVQYSTINGAAIAPGDYTAIGATTLTFGIGVTTQTFNVTIVNDGVAEPTEQFSVHLLNPSDSGFTGADSTVTIFDDDGAGTVQFSTGSYSVGEAGFAVGITVNRVNGSSGAISVQYSTSNGSALSGFDYTAIGLTTLNFANGETTKSFNVAILDDLLVEGNETFSVTLSNPTGTSITGSNPATVTIIENDGSLVPVVSSISPNFGPVTGGTYVTITGANFIPAGSTVYFGTTPVTPSTVLANTITVYSPIHIAGTVDVTVWTVNGTSATSYADLFSYGGLSGLNVTNLSPNGGPPTGGTTVTITGTGFTGATTVTFGGTPAVFYAVTDYSITATAPAHVLGTVDVIVGNGSVFSANTLADNYTYTVGPTITSIYPATGPSSGGTIVSITGTGFTGATSVYFGSVNAPSFGVTSPTTISVVAPPGYAGVVDITVTAPGGTSPTNVGDQFTYTGASVPIVTLVSPATGAAAGGTYVTITGSGFTSATSVTFGGTSASFTFISDSTITATSPAHANGTVHVVVTGPGGSSSATSADNYTYTGASATTTYTLSFRWTIIVWLGQDGASALTMLQGSSSAGTNNVSNIVTAIFRWDPSAQAWQAFFTSGAGVPGANDFTTLTRGQAYFIAVTSATSWTVTIG